MRRTRRSGSRSSARLSASLRNLMAAPQLYYTSPDTAPGCQIRLYCGDSTLFHPVERFGAVITDPIWPNNRVPEFAGLDGMTLLRSALSRVQFNTLVVHMGGDSDPRRLAAATDLPFLRACWLRYACPHYKGRLLYGADVAYVFGQWPQRAGVWPSETISSRRRELGGAGVRGTGRNHDSAVLSRWHCTPRRLEHVEWLVKWYGRPDTAGRVNVYDPFAGIGTTLLAAKRIGVGAVGVEISEEYCKKAVERLRRQKIG